MEGKFGKGTTTLHNTRIEIQRMQMKEKQNIIT